MLRINSVRNLNTLYLLKTRFLASLRNDKKMNYDTVCCAGMTKYEDKYDTIHMCDLTPVVYNASLTVTSTSPAGK